MECDYKKVHNHVITEFIQDLEGRHKKKESDEMKSLGRVQKRAFMAWNK